MKIYKFNFWNCKLNIIIILKKELRIILFEGNICLKENIKIIDILIGKYNNIVFFMLRKYNYLKNMRFLFLISKSIL